MMNIYLYQYSNRKYKAGSRLFMPKGYEDEKAFLKKYPNAIRITDKTIEEYQALTKFEGEFMRVYTNPKYIDIAERIINKFNLNAGKYVTYEYFMKNLNHTKEVKYVMVRNTIAYVLRFKYLLTFYDIGKVIGKNHATVIHGIKDLEQRKTSKGFKNDITAVKAWSIIDSFEKETYNTKNMDEIRIKIKMKDGAKVPFYSTEQAAGADLYYTEDDTIQINPGERKLIPTGIYMELPEGYEAQIRPRSGMALKNGITVLNTPGTIDADYRGEIGVILINQSNEIFTVSKGLKIAQMVISKYSKASFEIVDELEETKRNQGGFGSTGK